MCCISESVRISFFVMFRKGFCFAAFVFVVVRFPLDSGRLLGWMLKHFVFCSHPFFSECCFVLLHSIAFLVISSIISIVHSIGFLTQVFIH